MVSIDLDAQAIIDSIGLLQQNTLSFTLLLDETGSVISEGKGIRKLVGQLNNHLITDAFELINPRNLSELLSQDVTFIRLKGINSLIEFRCSKDTYQAYQIHLLHLTPIFTDETLKHYDEIQLNIPNHLLVSENLFLRGGIRSGLTESHKLIDELNQKNNEQKRILAELTKSNQYFARQHNEITQVSKWLEVQNQRMNLVFASSDIIGIEISLPDNVVSLYPEEALLINKSHLSNAKTLRQFMDFIHPEHRYGFKAHLSIKDQSFNYQFQLKQINGEYRWMKFVGDHYSFGRQNNFIFGILTDIDEEKTQESKMYAAQSFERHRISKTIHDQIGQSLIGLRFMLSQHINKSPDDDSLREVDKILDRVIKNSRQIIQALQIDITSYECDKEAFEYFLSLIKKVSPHRINLHWDGEEIFNNFSISYNLFVIFQELILFAIQNSSSYAINLFLTVEETKLSLKLEKPDCHLTPDELQENEELQVIKAKTSVLNGIFDISTVDQSHTIQVYIPR